MLNVNCFVEIMGRVSLPAAKMQISLSGELKMWINVSHIVGIKERGPDAISIMFLNGLVIDAKKEYLTALTTGLNFEQNDK